MAMEVVTVGKNLKRQITKYLNEIRSKNKDGNYNIKQGFRFNINKSSDSPPPIPQPDYTGSIQDDSDEGWDTDEFEDDEIEEDEDDEIGEFQSERDHSDGGDSGATNEVTEPDMKVVSSSKIGSQISVIIRKLNMSVKAHKGVHSRLSHSCSDLQDRPLAVRTAKPKRSLPQPPSHPIIPRKPIMRKSNLISQSTEYLSGRAVMRPLQQPPPPPPFKPHNLSQGNFTKTCSPVPKTDFSVSDMEFGENYEIPNSLGTPTPTSSISSISLNLNLDLNGRGYSEGEDCEHLTTISEPCDTVLEEDYELPEKSESEWSGSSGVSVKSSSSSSDRPILPPRGMIPLHLRKPTTSTPISCQYSPSPNTNKYSDDTIILPSVKPNAYSTKKNTLSNFTTNLLSEVKNRITSAKISDNNLPNYYNKDILSSSPSSEAINGQDTKRPLPPIPARPTVTITSDSPPSSLPVPAIKAPEDILDTFSWFHRVERAESEDMLWTLESQGAFLVRESKMGGKFNPYTLSVYNETRISHINIRRRPDGTYALGKEKSSEKTFDTVQELVKFHKKEPILLTVKGQQAGKTVLSIHPEKKSGWVT